MDDAIKLKDVTRSELFTLLDGISGEKDLVIDPQLIKVLDHFTNFSTLKKHGTVKMLRLDDTHIDSPTKNRVYLMRPRPHLCQTVISQVRGEKKKKESHNYYLFAVPRMTQACNNLLELHGLVEEIQVSDWPLDLIPLDKDLLSLELPAAFSDFYVAGDQHDVRTVAQSLITLQSLYGKIPQVHGIGRYSAMVKDLYQILDEDQRSGSSFTYDSGVPRIDQLILLDRGCDWVTPLCAPTTYEGLLDDVFGIQNGFVEFGKNVTGKEKPVRLLLNSSSSVYADIRSRHFSAVHPFLSDLIKQLQVGYDRRHEATTVTKMKAFVTELGSLKEQHRAVETHIGACEVINREKKSKFLMKQLQVEHAALEGTDEKECLEVIEELINRQVTWLIPLRLMCLLSLASGGLKPRAYQMLKTQYIQSYGYDYVITLNRLEDMGWLKEQVEKQPQVFRTATKRLKLIPRDVENYDLADPPDTAYVFGGAYCPLSCHLAQHAILNNGWKGIDDFCQQLSNDVFTFSQAASQRTTGASKGFTVVYFVGGCTFSEVNALRYIAKKNGIQIQIITTNLCNASSMLKDVVSYN